MSAVEKSFVQQVDGELRVSSETISERTGNEHRAVLQLVNSHAECLEQFGQVAFGMRPRPEGQHGGGVVRVAHLNAQQATLLMTFMRNRAIVVDFKVELVKQFYAMRQALTAPAIPQSFAEALELAAAQARELEVAKPKADAWDQLASAEGDYSVADAAKSLARAGVDIGPQRLFNQLAEMGWIFRGPHQHGYATGFTTAVSRLPREEEICRAILGRTATAGARAVRELIEKKMIGGDSLGNHDD